MHFNIDLFNVINILKTIFLLLAVFFLGYISAYLTNKQIEEYCFNYKMIKSFNEGIYLFNNISIHNFTYPYIYINSS